MSSLFFPSLLFTIHCTQFTTVSDSFLGAFAKLRKATISVKTVCLSVRMEQLGPNCTDFGEILYLIIIIHMYDNISLNSS